MALESLSTNGSVKEKMDAVNRQMNQTNLQKGFSEQQKATSVLPGQEINQQPVTPSKAPIKKNDSEKGAFLNALKRKVGVGS